MTTIYSAAKICPYNKQTCDLNTEGLSLDPGELHILSRKKHCGWISLDHTTRTSYFLTYKHRRNQESSGDVVKDYGQVWNSDWDMEFYTL
jgi:hypothetical protein